MAARRGRGAASEEAPAGLDAVVEETRYSPADLIAGAAGFGVKPEVMAGALRAGGVSEPIDRRRASELVARFVGMEV